ncbi:hypothetical protein Zmor_001356 [Zophobas morio]|uniref:Uncharacterized protein n=1 Tax=Zophobas morio TaxID=2755281 RepID=A0AA38J539_9CUCU|nr:hypothetical protein Zmor_001356 [Zophobas morio]
MLRGAVNEIGVENDVSPPVEEQPIYDENDEEEDEEDIEDHYGEVDFRFQEFADRLTHPKIVRACGLALRDFQSNSINTNNCIIKLLHRIAFDCKMYVMVFQVSIFRTFQKIYANKDFPEYRELVKFATYIIRQFIKVTEVNKKVYMESLFFKNRGEAYEIEYGYGSNHKSVSSRSWTEEEEDELRRLFMEHQQNQLEEDIVDWIVNNLIDNTRTRRGVLKKLKEMCLLVNYKGQKSGARRPQNWGSEEETQLRELYQQFRDAADPLGCIMARLNVERSKPKIVQKLLELGLIQDRAEVRKKRTKSTKVCAAMKGDSSSVTATGRRSHKDKSGAGYWKSRLRGSEKPRSGVREPSRGMYGFKYRPPSGTRESRSTSEVQTVGEMSSSSGCESPGSGAGKTANSQLFIVREIEKRPELLSKSQLPNEKAKKEKSLLEVVELYEVHLGRRISQQQLKKKINNMKSRLKKKTDKQKTGNKRITLHEWEKVLYKILEGDDNPTINKIPEPAVAGVAKRTQECEPKHREKKNCEKSIRSPEPKKSKLYNYETEETHSLTTTELQRLVLLEQLKAARLQREYILKKMERL